MKTYKFTDRLGIPHEVPYDAIECVPFECSDTKYEKLNNLGIGILCYMETYCGYDIKSKSMMCYNPSQLMGRKYSLDVMKRREISKRDAKKLLK